MSLPGMIKHARNAHLAHSGHGLCTPYGIVKHDLTVGGCLYRREVGNAHRRLGLSPPRAEMALNQLRRSSEGCGMTGCLWPEGDRRMKCFLTAWPLSDQ